MNIKNLIFILGISSFLNLLNASTLQCQDIYSTISSQKGNETFKTESTKSTGKTKIALEFTKKNAYLIVGKTKTELFFISQGSGAIYLVEKTSSGNVNLLSIFDDGTLSISKSYDVLGMAKLNVQTIYKCKDK